MQRADINHIIRAASDVTGERELVVIGSQAILGNHTDDELPADLLVSWRLTCTRPKHPRRRI